MTKEEFVKTWDPGVGAWFGSTHEFAVDLDALLKSERERYAKVADGHRRRWVQDVLPDDAVSRGYDDAASKIAADIRSLK